MNPALTRALAVASLNPNDTAALLRVASELRRLGFMGDSVGDQLLSDWMKDAGIDAVVRSVESDGTVAWTVGCGGASARVSEAGLYWRYSGGIGRDELLPCLHHAAKWVAEEVEREPALRPAQHLKVSP